MSLPKKDCIVGTLVDHRWKKVIDNQTSDGGQRWHREYRDPIRRGIIVGVDGDKGFNVTTVTVLFKPGEDPEKVLPVELDRYMKANTRVAKEALRRVRGEHKLIGREFHPPMNKRAVVSDPLALSETERAPKVYDDFANKTGMDIENPDEHEPTVVPDVPEPKVQVVDEKDQSR